MNELCPDGAIMCKSLFVSGLVLLLAGVCGTVVHGFVYLSVLPFIQSVVVVCLGVTVLLMWAVYRIVKR